MFLLSTFSTTPARLALIASHASRATVLSMPVPTIGADERSNGTAWRCMFDPIRARFASSCSKNGISDAATPAIMPEQRSISLTSSRLASIISPSCLASIRSSTIYPFSSSAVEAGAITKFSS